MISVSTYIFLYILKIEKVVVINWKEWGVGMK